MSNVIVTLGGVPFQDFEVPEKIVFGGAQRVAVQQLIGGGRVVNVLGGDDGEIIFAGICSGEEATERAQTLDVMRGLGAVIPLFWDEFFYNVVIAEFVADYTKPWWIPFSIRCVVTSDPIIDLVLAVESTAAAVASDIASAGGFSGLAGVSLAQLALPTAAGLAAATAAIGGGMVVAGNTLNGGASALAGAVDAASGVAAVNQVLGASRTLSGLGGMSGYVNRAAANFANDLP